MKRIHITLAQIQAFVTVAEAKSFTIASEQLGMTQSALSHAVAASEKELQVSLLERRNGILPTKIGQRVLLYAQKMLSNAERIRQETSAAVGLETGKVCKRLSKHFRYLVFAVPSLETATPAVAEFLNEAKILNFLNKKRYYLW